MDGTGDVRSRGAAGPLGFVLVWGRIMRNFRDYGMVISLAICAMTGGCTLTPAPETPPLVSDIRTSGRFLQTQSKITAPADTGAWWLGVGGKELDALVDILRHNSLALREARLQADQAKAAARIAHGQRLPSVAAVTEANANRRQGLNGKFSWSETYAAGLQVDFNTDIFGGLRAAKRSARLSALAGEISLRAAEQREIALLSRNWVSAVSLQRRADLARCTAESFRSTYDLTRQRYEAGSTAVSASDVQIARQNLESALVDIPQIDTDLTQQWLVLDEQLARMPGETGRSFAGALAPAVRFDAPVGSPAVLLANRPDVAVAELRYLAALEDVGAARASLYPGLSLAASLTFQADTPGELFDWDRHIASLASSLTAPVFQGGRLKAQVRLKEARAAELASAFARAALAAVVDVEIALAELAGLHQQKQLLDAALETARLSNEIAKGRYGQGLISILAVLETQRSLNAVEQNVILTDQAIANARIDLYLSLGGDWTGSIPAVEPAQKS